MLRRGMMAGSGGGGGGGGGGDPQWGSVIALVPMDEANGTSTFNDVTGRAWTAYGTGSYPVAQMSNAAPLVGPTSGLFQGDGSVSTQQSAIQALHDAAFNFGTSDFTIEWFQRWRTLSGFATALDRGYTGAGGLLLQTGNGDGAFNLYAGGSAIMAESSSPSTGVWYHYALQKDSGVIRLSRAGVQTASVANNFDFTRASDALTFAAAGLTGNINYGLDAYCAFLRITAGVCRYPGGTSFTPPSTPYPTSA